MGKVIFISGKYRADTEWELEQNIENARNAAADLWQQGYIVICPHMNSAHMGGLCDDSIWLDGYIEILKRCDAIYLLKGWEESIGSVNEFNIAYHENKEIFIQ